VPGKRFAAPAKLCPPRLQQTVPRQRLFAWLDGQRQHPGIWLSGQPGAGKTTLAAAYLQARGLAYLWYRLDTDDNDIGRFFGLLGDAAHALGPRIQLPRFAAEHLGQPLAYSRAWLRRLFAVLPRPMVLVFDNLEQAAMPLLPQVLAIALEEAPEGVTLLMTCRQSPPPELAAATLAGALAVLPSSQLAFSADEAEPYARSLGLEEGAVRRAVASVGGWAAGLRLLSQGSLAEQPSRPPEVLFDYFAGLLHDGLSANGQQLLLVAALLPWIPASLAGEVADVADPAGHLDRLCAHNLFTERVDRGAGLYRLHPMFREFLLERGRRTWAPGVRAALLRRAATAFAALGQTDIGIDLSLDAGDHPSTCRLLVPVLEAKLAQGRLDQLEAWVRRLPEGFVSQEPQLLYALARVCFLREDIAAVGHYERACLAFAALGDMQGQQLCAAGVLEWSYNTDSFIGHQRWCELLAHSLPDPPRQEEHRLRLMNGRLLACFFRGDFHTDAAEWTDRVLAMLAPGGAENDKLSVAITLLGCLERDKRWDAAQLLADRMEAMLASPNVGPRLAILVRQQIAADLHRQTGAYAQARILAVVARESALEQGFAVLEFEAVAIQLLAALYTGDGAETERLLPEMAALLVPGNVYHQRFWCQMRAWHDLQSGRLASAREHADALRAAVERSDMPPRFSATWLLIAIYVAFGEDQQEAACAELDRLCAEAEAGSRDTLRANLLSLQAWRHWRAERRADALRDLAEAWTLAAGIRYYQLLAPLRSILAELAALALANDVVVAFARELIRRRNLMPPTPTARAWPWSLQIVTLGRFAVRANDVPLVFPGKVPKKPLALLKALIAFGGQSVALHKLIDALWPDDEADAAHDAFNVALHRLRKLLPCGAEALQLHNGCVTLNPALCWTDVRAFETLVAAGATLPARDPAALAQALTLYAGHFLADEADEAWSLSTRERLRSKFKQTVMQQAQDLISAGRHEEALACYRQGLEIDDIDEQFYQGVMFCTLRLQRPAEGLAAYQRLKRLLSILMGVAPSERSEALHRQLRG
jgi:LuxR family maltose regulon positive regulatory protein